MGADADWLGLGSGLGKRWAGKRESATLGGRFQTLKVTAAPTSPSLERHKATGSNSCDPESQFLNMLARLFDH